MPTDEYTPITPPRPLHKAPKLCEVCGAEVWCRSPADAARAKYCSSKCYGLTRRKRHEATCVDCKNTLPIDSFPKGAAGHRSLRCASCRPTAPALRVHESPHPCIYCRKRFVVRTYLSRIKKRKFCSRACQYRAMTNGKRTCGTCLIRLPLDDFDYQSGGTRLAKNCRRCTEAREKARVQGLGYMVPAGQMVRAAEQAAMFGKVPYTLERDAALSMHGTPCGLCGAPGCSLRRYMPEIGFIEGNVEVLCYRCARWARGIGHASLDDETIVAHARAIVAYHDA